MKIFPAIDLRGGQVVRLTEGDYGRMQVYSADPLETALAFKAAGATSLHVVDLDGAKAGSPQNFGILRQMATQSGLSIQTGGGIRTAQQVKEVLALGIGRVILGTSALRNPEFLQAMIEKYGAQIAVGVDARDGRVAVSGWTEVTSMDAMTFCAQLHAKGVQTIIYTDIGCDGRLSGANMRAYEELGGIDGLNVIASGGITGYSEITALRDMGVYGAIVGKALYENRLDLATVLQIAGEGGA